MFRGVVANSQRERGPIAKIALRDRQFSQEVLPQFPRRESVPAYSNRILYR